MLVRLRLRDDAGEREVATHVHGLGRKDTRCHLLLLLISHRHGNHFGLLACALKDLEPGDELGLGSPKQRGYTSCVLAPQVAVAQDTRTLNQISAS